MKTLITLCAVALLTSCSTTQKKQVDNTPLHKTVIFSAKGTINGFVFPDYNFKQNVYTRKNMRTISMNGEYDSFMARSMLGELKDTVIFRLDKNLRWVLYDNKDDKKYIECPLSGCGFNILSQFDKKQDTNNDNQFNYDPNEKTECSTTMSKNSFTVKATGQKRKIAGHWTKEYKAKWQVEFKDKKGLKDKNTLNIVFWNTVPNKKMQEAWVINEAATKSYLSKIKKGNNPLGKYLPDNVFMALSAFSGDTSKKNKNWTNSVARKLAKAKGYPMSIKTEWYLDRKACPQPKPEKKKLDWSNPLAAIKDSVSSYTSKQAKKMFLPNPKEPIFRYVYDVTDIKVQPAHDSLFQIPAGYQLATRE